MQGLFSKVKDGVQGMKAPPKPDRAPPRGSAGPAIPAEHYAKLVANFGEAAVQRGHAKAQQLFAELDSSGDSRLDRAEFGKAMGLLGAQSPTLADLFYNAVDRDRNGVISYVEFLDWVLTLRYGSTEQKLRFGFNLLDQRCQGHLTQQDVASAALATFEALSGMEGGRDLVHETVHSFATELFRRFDTDRNGRMSFAEYRAGCLRFPSFVSSLGSYTDGPAKPGAPLPAAAAAPVADADLDAGDDRAFFGEKRFNWMLSVMAGLQLAVGGTADAAAPAAEAAAEANVLSMLYPAPPTPEGGHFSYPEPPAAASGLLGYPSLPGRQPTSAFASGRSWVKIDNPDRPEPETPLVRDPPPEPAHVDPSSDPPPEDVRQREWANIGGEGGFFMSAYAAAHFAAVRQAFGVDVQDFVQSLGISHVLGSLLMGDLCSLTAHVSEGKSKQMFFCSRDERYFVKTVSSAEASKLLNMVRDLLFHARSNPCTLLARLLGLYSIRQGSGEEQFFITMGTVFLGGPEKKICERYDLKGSTRGRTVGEANRGTPGLVHKDLDFLSDQGMQKLRLRPGDAAALRQQLRADAAFLEKQAVVDYSLLIGSTAAAPCDIRVARAHFVTKHRTSLKELHDVLMGGCHRRAQGLLQTMTFDSFCKCAFQHTPSEHPGARDHGQQQQQGTGVDFRRGAPTLVTRDGVSVYGERQLFLGIIDYLVPFDTRKQMEYAGRKLMAGGAEDFSVVPPPQYKERFVAFVEQIIEGDL